MPGHWARHHGLGCSSQPPPESRWPHPTTPLYAGPAGKGRISELEFVEWWNKATPAAKRLQKQLSLTAAGEVALEKTLFGDHDKEADEPKK